jgi:hypothetical protein
VPPNQTNVALGTTEAGQQVPIRQGNIFMSRGVAKLPFEFVRSSETPNDGLSLSPGLIAAQLKTRMDSLLGLRMFPITWPFRSCIEQKASRDLPHIRLAVVMVQGGQFFTKICLNSLGFSQLLVKSASEDNFGMVGFDIGLSMNCLCITLKTLEQYVRCLSCHQKHTPSAFLRQRHVVSEQDTLIKAIKIAVCDIVGAFGPHLDQTGLDTEAAEICQRVWEMEAI